MENKYNPEEWIKNRDVISKNFEELGLNLVNPFKDDLEYGTKIPKRRNKIMLGRNSDIFQDVSIMRAEIQTNGYKGGNASHGGYVSVELCDLRETNWQIDTRDDNGKFATREIRNLAILFKGDSEIRNFHRIITQWKQYLDYQLGEVED